MLESSADDPEFPAMQEFEVDEGGPKANTRKHPGLIWAIIAIVAVIALCIAFAAAGDWMNPTQAEKVQQTEFEEQTVPEDLGPNGNPEAAEIGRARPHRRPPYRATATSPARQRAKATASPS